MKCRSSSTRQSSQLRELLGKLRSAQTECSCPGTVTLSLRPCTLSSSSAPSMLRRRVCVMLAASLTTVKMKSMERVTNIINFVFILIPRLKLFDNGKSQKTLLLFIIIIFFLPHCSPVVDTFQGKSNKGHKTIMAACNKNFAATTRKENCQ